METIRTTAAYKAHVTRRARKAFRDAYPETSDIAEAILKGWRNDEITDIFNTTTGTVAAIKANLNRINTFSDMAYDCNF